MRLTRMACAGLLAVARGIGGVLAILAIYGLLGPLLLIGWLLTWCEWGEVDRQERDGG